jgi:ABC-2 type transport system ATP-binding protein
MIHLRDVVKEYGGLLSRARRETSRALDGVTLHVPPGAAVGLVGPNGAGKSTLIRLLLGYLRPGRGTVAIDEMPPRLYAERHGIAYVPDAVAIPGGWTVRQALETYAALGEVPDPHARIERELERLGLAEVAGRRVAALSRGNRQRLAIAQAFLGDRRLMILDEATDGLDPVWVVRVRAMLAEWRAADPQRVLLFASHDLDEVERVCDRAVMFRSGRIHDVFEVRTPVDGSAVRLEVEGRESAARVRDAFPAATPVAGVAGAYRIEATDDVRLREGLAALMGAGVTVRTLASDRGTLRERYVAAAESARDAGAAA